jgi:DNA polymerase III delta subunit
VIIKGKAIDQLTGGGAGKYCAVLFYGPDEGRVRESALLAARSICEDLSDPFRVVSLDGAEIRSDPARLAGEAAAISMTGGRRVLRLRNIGDAAAPVLAEFLQNPAGDSAIIAEAGALSKTSKLRKLFETSPICAIAACYEDNSQDLAALITRHLRQNDLTITSEAMSYLQTCLGEDRLATRQELDKLVIYMGSPPVEARDSSLKAPRDTSGILDNRNIIGFSGVKDLQDASDIPATVDTADTGDSMNMQDVLDVAGVNDISDISDIHEILDGGAIRDIPDSPDISDITANTGVTNPKASPNRLPGQVTLQDVLACIGDSTSQGLDEICDAMALGDPAQLDYRLGRGMDASLSPVAILRAASSHLFQLHLALGSMAQGIRADQALRSIRPPLHFSRTAAFRDQMKIWDLHRLIQALDLLLQAESLCKSSLAVEESICSHTLHQVALLARKAH